MTCDTLMDFISSMRVVLSNIYYTLGSVSIEKSTLCLCIHFGEDENCISTVSNNRIKCWAHFNSAIISMDCVQVSEDEMKSARSC